MGRAVKPAKRITDRRRAGAGDNVAFTVRHGHLGAGKRVASVSSPTIAKHQFTNRGDRVRSKGKKTI